MSCPSYICKELPNGRYKVIFCCENSYISHNGIILNYFYNTEKKINNLLSLGDLTNLGIVTDFHKIEMLDNYNTALESFHISFFCRKGLAEKASKLTLKNMLKNIWIKYFYIYDKNGKWWVSTAFFPNAKQLDLLSKDDLKSTFIPLEDVIKKELTKEEQDNLEKIAKDLTTKEQNQTKKHNLDEEM